DRCGGDGDRRQGEWELEAAVAVEEALRPMDDGDRVQHHDRQAERGQWREEAGGEEQAAALAEAGEDGQQDRRTEAEVLEKACGSAQAVAAEPAEQLLCSVREDRPARDDAQEQESICHSFLLAFAFEAKKLLLTQPSLRNFSSPRPGFAGR